MKPQLSLLLLFLSTSLLISVAPQTQPLESPPPRRRLRSPPPPSHPPPPPPALGCSTQVLAFSVCLAYISDPPNNLTNSPSPLCCNAYESTFRAGEANCLCYLSRQSMMFGFPINTTKLYSLSSFCPMSDSGSEDFGTLQSVCSVSVALPPLSSTPGSGFSTPHNIDIGSSLPPISSSLPKPFGDLAPPDSADEAPSEPVTPVFSYNLTSAAEQLSKNHLWFRSRALITVVFAIYCLCSVIFS
ncbi:non-specific lipid transfer protein GPI-anchored 25 isoform X1 [Apium graveolens]|uniref:non-specific lipid transfer protein GPI-anchored 25 isoform X1 n=1 Tax=Apium graveolens TaxID=4045 RepID=UPI003D793023